MNTIRHSDLGGKDIHKPHAFEYANVTELNGAIGFKETDVGKWAKVVNEYYVLDAIEPIQQNKVTISTPTTDRYVKQVECLNFNNNDIKEISHNADPNLIRFVTMRKEVPNTTQYNNVLNYNSSTLSDFDTPDNIFDADNDKIQLKKVVNPALDQHSYFDTTYSSSKNTNGIELDQHSNLRCAFNGAVASKFLSMYCPPSTGVSSGKVSFNIKATSTEHNIGVLRISKTNSTQGFGGADYPDNNMVYKQKCPRNEKMLILCDFDNRTIKYYNSLGNLLKTLSLGSINNDEVYVPYFDDNNVLSVGLIFELESRRNQVQDVNNLISSGGYKNGFFSETGEYTCNKSCVIKTKPNQIKLENCKMIESVIVDAEIPAHTFINWAVSFDKGNTQYTNKWCTQILSDLQADSATGLGIQSLRATLREGFTNYDMSNKQFIDFAFIFKTPCDINETPSIKKLTINYKKAGKQEEENINNYKLEYSPSNTKVTKLSGGESNIKININI